MKRIVIRTGLALLMIGAGWVAGRAQTATPDFELLVNAPSGKTTVECVRGCKISWVERGVNPGSDATPSFEYGCSGARCSSGRIGGWVQK